MRGAFDGSGLITGATAVASTGLFHVVVVVVQDPTVAHVCRMKREEIATFRQFLPKI